MDFRGLGERTLALVVARGGVEVPVEPAYGTQVVRDTTLSTRCFRLPAGGEVRMVSIEGAKVHILNVFLWPLPSQDAPVYAMEFVAFGPRPIVAVIDAVGLSGSRAVDEAAALMQKAHARFPFPAGDDMPDWFLECRSGHEYFVRPQGVVEFEPLGEAHLGAFTDALEALGTRAAADPSAHAEALSSYQHHHAENSPGRRWLQASFGESWALHYLHEIVFAPAIAGAAD